MVPPHLSHQYQVHPYFHFDSDDMSIFAPFCCLFSQQFVISQMFCSLSVSSCLLFACLFYYMYFLPYFPSLFFSLFLFPNFYYTASLFSFPFSFHSHPFGPFYSHSTHPKIYSMLLFRLSSSYSGHLYCSEIPYCFITCFFLRLFSPILS